MKPTRALGSTFIVAICFAGFTTVLVALPTSAEDAPPSGAEDLFRRGVEALKAERYSDAASLFRTSYNMEKQAATQCNLALTYERWGGHEAHALEAYRLCAAEDETGRFRDHALEKVAALEASAVATKTAGLSSPFPTPVGATVQWQEISKTEGCSFFSGPAGLGQVDQLGTKATLINAGGDITLSFEGDRSFHGKQYGTLVTLARQSVYLRAGTRWIVEEAIAGMLEEGALHGHYHYRECDEQSPDSCPSGCAIRATLAVSISR